MLTQGTTEDFQGNGCPPGSTCTSNQSNEVLGLYSRVFERTYPNAIVCETRLGHDVHLGDVGHSVLAWRKPELWRLEVRG